MDVRGDFLVIGSGIAGLRAALTLAESGDVIVLTKADPTESNTGYAQGGIAAALGPGDSPALHAQDTIAAGDGLCDPAAVDVLVRQGPKYVVELLAWGAQFDRETDGSPALGREAAHSVRRVLHAHDATGREIGRLLWSRVSANPRIRVMQDAGAIDLVVANGTCAGARYAAGDRDAGTITAARTLLATGGAGQVFRETTNPSIATGDGIAMAADAGARVEDLEFIQFHPTVMSVPGKPRFLLSEALRGEGARLVNHAGDRFMQRYEPAGDLASRDLVSRAIVREMEQTHEPVYLSLAHMDRAFVHERFPTIAQACANAGLDLAVDRIPVSPAAHYIMGGVETDLDGRTSVEGLFAAGEVACTCAWRQPPCQQFAARRARFWRARGRRDDRAAACLLPPYIRRRLMDPRRQATAKHRAPCRRRRSRADVEELRLAARRARHAGGAHTSRGVAWHRPDRARVARGRP